MLDDQGWENLTDRERSDLELAFGENASAFDARTASERTTLRCIRLAMSPERIGARLWDEVTGLLWVSPNQIGLVVRDADRFYQTARSATRPDGASAFHADPRWLLWLFKHGAEWSLRETGSPEWGLQLYRRGRTRSVADEIVADVDRVTLSAGAVAHVRDVLRPGSDPTDAWNSLTKKG